MVQQGHEGTACLCQCPTDPAGVGKPPAALRRSLVCSSRACSTPDAAGAWEKAVLPQNDLPQQGGSARRSSLALLCSSPTHSNTEAVDERTSPYRRWVWVCRVKDLHRAVFLLRIHSAGERAELRAVSPRLG